MHYTRLSLFFKSQKNPITPTLLLINVYQLGSGRTVPALLIGNYDWFDKLEGSEDPLYYSGRNGYLMLSFFI